MHEPILVSLYLAGIAPHGQGARCVSDHQATQIIQAGIGNICVVKCSRTPSHTGNSFYTHHKSAVHAGSVLQRKRRTATLSFEVVSKRCAFSAWACQCFAASSALATRKIQSSCATTSQSRHTSYCFQRHKPPTLGLHGCAPACLPGTPFRMTASCGTYASFAARTEYTGSNL